MLQFTEKQAERIVRRWIEHEAPAHDRAMEADAGFDGGEWSVGFHEASWMLRLERVESRVSLLTEGGV